MSSSIQFYCENVSYRIRNIKLLRNWIINTAKSENKICDQINFILCSDDYLLDINKKFLNHNYFTDVITFDYSEKNIISGDIYISIDRVKENSRTFSIPTKDELNRVIIHGILHLLGYSDKTPAQKLEMKSKEDFYLSLRTF